MPKLHAPKAPLDREAASATLEITCETAVGLEADQLILQLACALARLAAREDDARENARPVTKRE